MKSARLRAPRLAYTPSDWCNFHLAVRHLANSMQYLFAAHIVVKPALGSPRINFASTRASEPGARASGEKLRVVHMLSRSKIALLFFALLSIVLAYIAHAL